MPRTAIQLIPWDADSREHADRLIEQRIACGWHADKVEGQWKEAQKDGTKCIYWLTIARDDPNHASLMEAHAAAFPKQATHLLDTAAHIRGTDRNPTHQSYNPIGHISLDMEFPGVEPLSLDMPATGSIWIKSLYVSDPLQSSGLGRTAMDALEAMATGEPHYATTLMLDAVCKEDQLREDLATSLYGYVPKIANEEWYSRRGYRVVKRVPRFYKEIDQERFNVTTVFMRRDLG